jgi:hypothetical protein
MILSVKIRMFNFNAYICTGSSGDCLIGVDCLGFDLRVCS